MGQTPVTSLLPDLGLCREVGASSTHTQSALAIWDTLRVRSQARTYLELSVRKAKQCFVGACLRRACDEDVGAPS